MACSLDMEHHSRQDLVCPNEAFAVVLHSELHMVSVGIVHGVH